MKKITVTFNEQIRRQLISGEGSAEKITLISAILGTYHKKVAYWFKNNSEKLIQYDVLLAVSKVLNIPIEEIITVENQ